MKAKALIWKDHDGGKMPMRGSYLAMLEFRNGKLSDEPVVCGKWRWERWAAGVEHDFDIVRYAITSRG